MEAKHLGCYTLPLVLLFSPVVTRAFPWPIKRKAGRPTKGIDRSIEARPDRTIANSSNLEPTRTQHKHKAEQQSSSRHLFTLSIRDLGPIPLSPVCNPYYKLFSASNMSNSNELDVGIFHLNQYKPRVLLAHHLSQTRNIRNLIVGGNSKHRQRLRLTS